MLNCVHSGNVGDLILSLPTVISLLEQTGNDKANFHLKVGEQAYYHTPHPLKNVKLNEVFAEQLIPLLESQSYINQAKIYENESVDVDLDDFRTINIPQNSSYIARWYFYAFMASFDLSQPWLKVKPNKVFADYILVNRSSRYRNISITYNFLSKYKVMFVGLEDEYKSFLHEVPNAEHYQCKDFLDMAEIASGAGLIIGNQSSFFIHAEAVKAQPRILEVCPYCPNIIPHGKNAYDFWSQQAFETIVGRLGAKFLL